VLSFWIFELQDTPSKAAGRLYAVNIELFFYVRATSWSPALDHFL
jgi:hypothetical protein